MSLQEVMAQKAKERAKQSVEGGLPALMEAARAARKGAATPETSMVEQSMSGVNEGIATVLGAPIDFANFTADLPAHLINKVFGTDLKTSGDLPEGMGTSDAYRQGMTDLGMVSDVEPQTRAQRYARRVGQEVGATAIPGGLLARYTTAPLTAAALEATAAVGSGVGGQTSREIAPDNDLADFMASMVGGGGLLAAAHAGRPSPKAPSMEELRTRQKGAYNAVEQSPARFTPESTERMQAAVKDRSARDKMDPVVSPKASRTADIIGEMQNPSIMEVEKARRLANRIARNPDASEGELGAGMKEEITKYLDSVTAEDVTGGDPSAAVASLHEGREMTRRIKKSEQVSGALTKAERRAASTGTGGNEINAIRQNIRAILDDPKKRAGFSKDELDAMDAIVRGTRTTNALRHVGKFSPTTGALQGALGGGLFSSAAYTGNPFLALPPVAGYLAKAAGEGLTSKQIRSLEEMIRNGATVPKKLMNDPEKTGLLAWIASQSTAEVE